MSKSNGKDKRRNVPRSKWLSAVNITLIVSLAGNALTLLKMLPEFKDALIRADLLTAPTAVVRFSTRHENLRKQGIVDVSAGDGLLLSDRAFDTDVSLPRSNSYRAVPRLQYLRLPFEKTFAYEQALQVVQIDDTFAVQGKVIRKGEEEGVAGAVISFEGETAVSDAGGEYFIDGLTPRTRYNVTICPRGHGACDTSQLVRLTFAPDEGKRVHQWNALLPKQ